MALDSQTIRESLKRLGQRLSLDRDVEILIVGGGAGVLMGELSGVFTTGDVDVIHFHLPEDRDAVLEAAGEVGRELSLPPSWMNEDSGLYAWTLADDWKDRRMNVGTFGRLVVFTVGRVDLIAMKFLAHRAIDLEHLVQMRVQKKEIDFVRRHLEHLAEQFPEQQGRIDMTRSYIDGWKIGR